MLSRRCQHFLIAAKRVSVRNASDSATSIPPPKKWGKIGWKWSCHEYIFKSFRRGRAVFWLITSVGAGLGGTLAVAYLDSDARNYLEDSIPGAKPVFLQLLGEPNSDRYKVVSIFKMFMLTDNSPLTGLSALITISWRPWRINYPPFGHSGLRRKRKNLQRTRSLLCRH